MVDILSKHYLFKNIIYCYKIAMIVNKCDSKISNKTVFKMILLNLAKINNAIYHSSKTCLVIF